LVPVALLAGACSWYSAERGQRLEQRVDRMEEERPIAPDGDAASSAAIREQLTRVDAALADVRKRLEGIEAAPRPGAPPSEGQRQLAEELSRLRATLEQHAQRLDAMDRALAQARRGGVERVPEPRRAPEKAAKAEAPPSAEATGVGQEGGTGGTGGTGVTGGALALARERERKGDKAVARELYQQYVAQFPTEPGAAEAHYRLGELAFGDRKYGDAITEYGKVAKEFPRSDRAPDALLRTADSMVALGLKDDAALLLSEIPRRYPGTPAAARATRRLSELSKAPAGKTNE
jgi:tol-pal system protein YbgF